MEGKFYRNKTPNHPHTNMAKAAANMMTRTCAGDLARKGIYMNSVDTVRASILPCEHVCVRPSFVLQCCV